MTEMFKPIFIILIILPSNCLLTISHKSKTALFISIPFVGHINPLLRQAIELYHRHPQEYHIYVISCSNLKTYVEKTCLNTTIKFLDIGPCRNETDLSITLEQIALENNPLPGASKLYQAGIEYYYPQMYEQILNTINPNLFNNQQTIIAIIDRLTFAGADIADYYNISYIINGASLLPYIGWHDIPPSDSNPAILCQPPQSIHSLGTHLFFRAISPLIRYVSMLYVYFRYDRYFNHLRQTKFHLNKTYHLWSRYNAHLYLMNNGYGLEYAHYLPPNVQFTGPMLSMTRSLDDYRKELSDEDRKWIEYDHHRPIIYISFGTCAPISNEILEKLLNTIEILNHKYRFIWKLDRNDMIQSTSTLRIVQWISSQLGFLAHQHVQLFISHCGLNSVYESIWLGTSVLCIPIFADQLDMAQRLEDAHVGKWLNKLTFTSEQLQQTIESMFQQNEISVREKNIKRIQTLLKLHGGVERAVDLIEIVAEYGIDALVPVKNYYPWYAYYNLDVYLIWFIILFGIQWLIRRCCCCFCCKTRSIAQLKIKTS